jgi:hypothetical protein
MKTQRSTSPLTIAALTALLTGCGGGGHSSSTLPSVTQHAGTPSSVTFKIQIPAKTGSATTRSPRYISAATQSLAVIVTPSGGTAAPPQTFNLTPTSPNCSGTPLTCTIAIDAPSGADTFDFTMYDGLNATGNKLSHSSTPFTIAAGKANTVTAVLGGIVSSFSIGAAPWTKVFAEGTAGAQAYTITAQDASGQTILGPYDQPVSVSALDPNTNGASGIVSLSAAQFAQNGDTVTASYGGMPAPEGATLAFTLGTKTLATATIAAFPPSLLPATWTPQALNGVAGANGTTLKLVGWYDAQDRSTMTFTGTNLVKQLNDKSGNSSPLNLVAAPGGEPTYDPTGGPWGRASLDFASGKCLPSPNNGFPTTADPTNHGDYTLLVMVLPSQAGTSNILSGGYPSPGGHLFWFNDITGNLSMARASNGLANQNNIQYASAPTGPPAAPYLAEGDYDQTIHMGTVWQGAPGTPDYSGGDIYLAGPSFGLGNTVSVTINTTTVTYPEITGDTAATTAAGVANKINNDPTLKTIVKATADPVFAPFQVLVAKLPGGPAITAFTATGSGADVTIPDNGHPSIGDPGDPSFALNCYGGHLDSSQNNHITEAIIFNGLLTSTQRTQLRTYLNRKWNQGYPGL